MGTRANDRNGVAVYAGDLITFRAKVLDVKDEHVLTQSDVAPFREFWFHGSVVERTEQGAISKEVDRVISVGAAPPAPVTAKQLGATELTPTAPVTEAQLPTPPAPGPDPNTPREQAIAWTMAKGGYDRAAGEKIVDEHGWKVILDDRANEQKAGVTTEETGTQQAGAGSVQSF